jgi:serine/threonine-protein kinase
MLSHPNIVTVYDVSRSSDVEYIVMELIEGITLKQYLQKRGVLSWKEALHFSSQITKALMHAHSRGIIHRDIKPHNIMILRDSSVKVADFGIARPRTPRIPLRTRPWAACIYFSPEQAKGGRIDARTDIYSLGVVMYEMVTGRLPFEGDSAISVAMQHISSVPLMPREINPDIPEGFENIIMRAMSARLEQRYQSADRLYEDLESLRKNPDYKFDYSDLEFKPRKEGPTPPRERQSGAEPREGDGAKRAAFLPSQKEKICRGREYIKNTKKARTVTLLSGVFCVLVFLVCIFLYLKNTWFDDMFAEPENDDGSRFCRLPHRGYNQQSRLYRLFRSRATREASDAVEEGYVIEQSPTETAVIRSDVKPTIKLIVSSGSEKIFMPDVVNTDYRSAKINLEKLKLKVAEPEFVASENITKDYV